MSQSTQDSNMPTTPPATDPKPAEVLRATKQNLEDIIALQVLESTTVSPATAKRAKFILDRWESASKDSGIIVALASEMHRRVLGDAKYAAALARVEELNVMTFKLRYGDYLASSLQEWQKSSRRLEAAQDNTLVTPGNAPSSEPFSLPRVQEEALAFFKSRKWSDVLARLDSEEGAAEPYGFLKGEAVERSPILHLIQVLAGLNNTTAEAIIGSMKEYVGRDGIAHSRISEYAAEKKTILLASTIVKDLQDLNSAPAACQKAVPAIRQAIWKTIHKHFAVFEWIEEEQQCSGYSRRDDSRLSG
ncbi:hypothetical protein J3F83DRAFT_742619 [Trichoderma novae-zelandiae]